MSIKKMHSSVFFTLKIPPASELKHASYNLKPITSIWMNGVFPCFHCLLEMHQVLLCPSRFILLNPKTTLSLSTRCISQGLCMARSKTPTRKEKKTKRNRQNRFLVFHQTAFRPLSQLCLNVLGRNKSDAIHPNHHRRTLPQQPTGESLKRNSCSSSSTSGLVFESRDTSSSIFYFGLKRY